VEARAAAECAAADLGHEHLVLGGVEDEAHNHLLRALEGDGDREVGDAVEEVGRAVERVDDEA
jgi:hypothetical protein